MTNEKNYYFFQGWPERFKEHIKITSGMFSIILKISQADKIRILAFLNDGCRFQTTQWCESVKIDCKWLPSSHWEIRAYGSYGFDEN